MTRSRLTLPKLVVLGVIIMALSGGYAIAVWVEKATNEEQRADQAEQTTEQVVQPAESLADRVRAACRAERADPETNALREAGLCASADKTKAAIKDAPTTTTTPTQTEFVPIPGPPGPGPTLAQIGRAVSAAIDDVVSAQIDEAVGEQIGPALIAACGGSCNGTNGTDGADGGAGKDGANGKDAPRVRSISCDGTTGVFVFTDDSTIRVSDMCAGPTPAEPAPEPEPDDSGLLTP